jgi:hypothetical protein
LTPGYFKLAHIRWHKALFDFELGQRWWRDGEPVEPGAWKNPSSVMRHSSA